ncbi:ABC transporter ATP-binding protein [Paenalkalicoccus suaedae]|uniref:ABC transporter ATP-binding protein n=1 Tax=Paenalkalicoccus suaedae TaxID=2592382 RepID=A0A859FAR9_9BACI|nr:ABC transporter ATP-binding protein [Paenalkalicoccus suaedae]QKS69872.1 ABC transporter ATP-binding protein [Paenalkalicoccus suaedae]
MTAPLAINKVTKTIDDFQLHINNLHIEEGTITAIIGANGAGKSTLFKMIMNLVKQESGSIQVYGESVNAQEDSWKQHIAYQAQTLHGYDAFTGKMLGTLMSDIYPNWDEALYRSLSQKLDVPLNKRVKKLSPGVKTKLNIALTLAKNTPFLLLDEPTAAMDIPSRTYFLDTLLQVTEERNKTVVFASHQADDIKKLADYLVFLQDGKASELFEKDTFTSSYRQFWLKDEPETSIPGEIQRTYKKVILSNDPDATLDYITHNNLEVMDEQVPELEDIIPLLLTKGE